MKFFLAILVVLVLHRPGLALTIATGSSEGTYFKIAQDIKQIAEKEGIPIEVVPTGGSFDNINLLAAGKVDLAIMQLDVLRFVADIMKKEAGVNVLQEAKVALNLYLEEIHVITKNPAIRTLEQLQGKKVAVGPEKSGSALTAEVLLAGFGLQVERVFDAPEDAVKKLEQGALDALMFVAGAPVPAFQKLDSNFRFVSLPADSGLEQIYPKKRIPASIYAWTGESDTHAVPSAIMTRNRADPEYIGTIQKLILLILTQKDYLDANGHPKWKDSFIRSTQGAISYAPAAEAIQLYNALDSIGYRIIKK
jgi:TRAP transporter TAXI family solute receptor